MRRAGAPLDSRLPAAGEECCVGVTLSLAHFVLQNCVLNLYKKLARITINTEVNEFYSS